jgi:hypothetical protein
LSAPSVHHGDIDGGRSSKPPFLIKEGPPVPVAGQELDDVDVVDPQAVTSAAAVAARTVRMIARVRVPACGDEVDKVPPFVAYVHLARWRRRAAGATIELPVKVASKFVAS